VRFAFALFLHDFWCENALSDLFEIGKSLMNLLILFLVDQWYPKLSYYFNRVVSCFGVYFKIGHFVYFYVHKQLNLGDLVR
jgi:hypothetical protein